MSLCRIMIVDDHPLFRDGLKALVHKTEGYEIIAEAGSCAVALEQALERQPDVAIIDISLPDGSGIELVRELQTRLPALKIVVVSMHSKIEFIAESFRAGAGGYVLKESTTDRLAQALDAVLKEEQYLDSGVSPKVLQTLLDFCNRRDMITDSPYSQLSRREQQVFRLLAEGLHPSDIAKRLFISRKTVDNHRANIMSKLSLSSPVELVRYAARLGVVDLDG